MILPLFKAFKAPNANISININKSNFDLGENIEGTISISSQESFEADEIRVELLGWEKIKPGGGMVFDNQETPETRLYSHPNPNTQTSSSMQYSMYKGKTQLVQNFQAHPGLSQQLPFQITIPRNLGPTFQGMRKDRKWLQRTWAIKAVLAVGGRPDVDTQREIYASIPSSMTANAQPTVAAQPNEPATAYVPPPPQPREMITSCSRCGGPVNPTQEDLIVTCRYCGFTISMGTREEIKNHSMLENHLLTQQAVEAAQKFMDKGIFRSGVAADSQITQVKLRYLPFWAFPVSTYTSYSGVTGAGLSGEFSQVQNAFSDKRASKLSKFGSLLKAGASAYMESQSKDRRPTTVSLSFSSHYTWPILARHSIIREIKYYDVPAARKIPFDTGRIAPDAEFLNTEYKQEEAKLKVKAEVEERERRIACGKVDSLQSCSINVTIGEGELIHAPIWFVYYCLKGENYTILVDGSEGKILGGGKPLFHV